MSEQAEARQELLTHALQGVKWTGLARVFNQASTLGVNIVLARLLAPADFGLLGIALIFTGALGVITELGFSAALIQRKVVDEAHRSTAFWTALGVGGLLCGLTWAGSPWAATYFAAPPVRAVLDLLALQFIVAPLATVQGAMLARELQFQRLALREIAATAFGSIVKVVLALLGFGVWSLVYGTLLTMVFNVLLLWTAYRWRPAMRFSRTAFRELFGFGGHLTLSNVLDFVSENVDYFIVGKFLGAAPLGIYTLSYNLVTFPQRKMVSVLSAVTFPTFSRLQHDDAALRRAYLRLVSYVSLASFPMLIGLIIVAPEFIRVVYGEKWIEAILPIQILGGAGIAYALGTTVGSIILPKGRADMALWMNAFRAVILTTFYLIGVQYGVAGVAVGLLGYAVVFVAVFQWFVNRLIDLRMRDFILALWPATLGSLVMGLALLSLRLAQLRTEGMSDIQFLSSAVILGALAYGLTLKAGRFSVFDEMLALIVRMFRRAPAAAPSEQGVT
jgi:O-antigen/teichoic acid export membrane protein